MSEARSAESDRELVAELRKLIKGDICSQFDPDYSREVRKVWNARLYEKKPLLYVNVECQDDISETLEFCKRHKVAIEIFEMSLPRAAFQLCVYHTCAQPPTGAFNRKQ